MRLELVIRKWIDRFNPAIDVIGRVPKLLTTGAHAKEKFRKVQIKCVKYAHEHGNDLPEVDGWRWQF
jgi:xylulose-5-phosphate/fructose-6-phosphate phosphoketolase